MDHPIRVSLSERNHKKSDKTMAVEKISDVEFPLGGLNRKISIQKNPKSETKHANITFQAEDIAHGTNPYWAKVTQQDMEMAWISPVFAKYYGK